MLSSADIAATRRRVWCNVNTAVSSVCCAVMLTGWMTSYSYVLLAAGGLSLRKQILKPASSQQDIHFYRRQSVFGQIRPALYRRWHDWTLFRVRLQVRWYLLQVCQILTSSADVFHQPNSGIRSTVWSSAVSADQGGKSLRLQPVPHRRPAPRTGSNTAAAPASEPQQEITSHQ